MYNAFAKLFPAQLIYFVFFLFDLVQSTHFKRRNGPFKKRYAYFTSPIEMKYSRDVFEAAQNTHSTCFKHNLKQLQNRSRAA